MFCMADGVGSTDPQGEVLPGADWQLKRADSVRELEARSAHETQA